MDQNTNLDTNLAPAKGRLIMAATSLGNPLDIPVRSLQALREADLVIFEESKVARGFLKAAGVHREFLTFSEHNQALALESLVTTLKAGKTVVYMSDQGSPTLADPGLSPLKIAWERGAEIRVIPGPSSVTAALSACPLPCPQFAFLGLLPREPAERERDLRNAGAIGMPLVILDTPYRLKALLSSCFEVFGGGRRGFVALDIGGDQEAYWLGDFSALIKRAERLDGKVNFVLVIEGGSKAPDLARVPHGGQRSKNQRPDRGPFRRDRR